MSTHVRKLLLLLLLGIATNYFVVLALVVHDARKAYGLFRNVETLLSGQTKPLPGRRSARVVYIARASGQGVTRVTADRPLELLFCDCATPRLPIGVVVDGTPARQFTDEFTAGTLDSTPLPDGIVWTMSGWPMNSLYARHRATFSGPGTVLTPRLLEGGMLLPVANRYGVCAILPLTPMWNGFAVNTTTWMALWSVPLIGIPAFRTRQRALAGRCTRCRYILLGNTSRICPECGTPVQTSRA